MRISKKYMMTHDIDWFCCVNDQYLLHFASNGSILPDFVADYRVLREIQQTIAYIPNFIQEESLRIEEQNLRYARELVDFEEGRYLESFKFFATKGFYSFDYEWQEEGRGSYRLLVGPNEPLSADMSAIVRSAVPRIYIEGMNNEAEMFDEIVRQIRR